MACPVSQSQMQNIFVFALEWPALQASLEANSKVGLVAS
jgi:hypothetical protein